MRAREDSDATSRTAGPRVRDLLMIYASGDTPLRERRLVTPAPTAFAGHGPYEAKGGHTSVPAPEPRSRERLPGGSDRGGDTSKEDFAAEHPRETAGERERWVAARDLFVNALRDAPAKRTITKEAR